MKTQVARAREPLSFGDFTENIVVEGTIYRMLQVLSFCKQEMLFLYIFEIEVSVVLKTT